MRLYFWSVIRLIPNFLTLLNLVAGCSAIAALFENKPFTTLVLAVLCLVLDVMDGLLARRLNVSSPLGEQLDSLADLVSFGVLPSFILFVIMKSCLTQGPPSVAYMAFLFAGSAALRLGRFNMDKRERTAFYGLPTPSAATCVFGLLWMQVDDHAFWPVFCQPVVIYGVLLLLPLLMLSDLRLWSLKGTGKPHGKWIFSSLLLMAALLIGIFGAGGVVLTVIVYLIFGLANVFLKLY